MAAIWHDIEIEWDDEVYTIRPTLEFLNHMERKPGRSLSKLMIRAQDYDLPSGAACELVADALQYAGAKVTAEDVFQETAGVGVELMTIVTTILTGCMPAPKEIPGGKKKKPVPKKRTGKNSTASR